MTYTKEQVLAILGSDDEIKGSGLMTDEVFDNEVRDKLTRNQLKAEQRKRLEEMEV